MSVQYSLYAQCSSRRDESASGVTALYSSASAPSLGLPDPCNTDTKSASTRWTICIGATRVWEAEAIPRLGNKSSCILHRNLVRRETS